MSLLYDDDQRAIAEESRRVLNARVSKDRLLGLLEQTGAIDTAFWDTVVEQGWTALGISEENGGIGLGLVELGLIAQAAGAATSGAPFLASGFAVAQALAASDDREAQRRFLPGIAAGEVKTAIAFGEGTEILPEPPTTTFAGGRLSGVKEGVTGGHHGDLALVWAWHDGSPALVVAELESVSRQAVDTFDNARLVADLAFADTPATLLFGGAQAREQTLAALARLAVVTAHEQTGGAEELMRLGRDYALTRKAFGQAIGGFQSVKHRLAELYGLVEIARANCIHAASLEGTSGFLEAAATARISATEAYDTAARDVIQIHGGIGVTWEAGLHLHMRRARSLAIECGNLLFWEDLLVEQLTGVAP